MKTLFLTRSLALAAGVTAIVIASLSAKAQTLAEPPEDQGVYLNETATFSVDPNVPGVGFQWIRMSPEGYVELPGETNQNFVLGSVRIDDAGWYACKLSAGDRTEFSKAASLCVAVVPERPLKEERKSTLSSSVELASNAVATLSTNDTIVIYAVPVPAVSTLTGCPGRYVGYATYTLPLAQGWGWAPSTNTTVHVARDITRTDTKTTYAGKYGDSGCAVGSVTIPHPTLSPKYRFAVYFPNSLPSTSYPLQLEGFKP